MDAVKAADIRGLVPETPRETAREIARTLTAYGKKWKVTVWELSYEADRDGHMTLLFDGWNNSGELICHHGVG